MLAATPVIANCVSLLMILSEGEDFVIDYHKLQLPASSSCHQLEIVDDIRPEFNEVFFICAETESVLVHITTDCAEVHIFDDDSKHANLTLSF